MIARGNTLNDGTTAAGKSTVGTYKFMLKVAESNSMYQRKRYYCTGSVTARFPGDPLSEQQGRASAAL